MARRNHALLLGSLLAHLGLGVALASHAPIAPVGRADLVRMSFLSKKSNTKKLVISRTVLRNLKTAELAPVAGGATQGCTHFCSHEPCLPSRQPACTL
jgi:hypothetical protein